jgi:hypothetical protein
MVMRRNSETNWELVAMEAILEATYAQKSTSHKDTVTNKILDKAKFTSHEKVMERSIQNKVIYLEYPDIVQTLKGLLPYWLNCGKSNLKIHLIPCAELS